MKAKYLGCVWCGGDIGGMTAQERKESKKPVKPSAQYCSRKCRKEATNK